MASPIIHPSAVVDPKAVLADGVEIGPFAVVGPEVELGAGTYVGPHSIVEHATLGRDNRLIGHAAVGTPPQDFRYRGEKTRLVMGDRNIVREGVTLNRGTTATGLTVIGNDCMFMALSHVAHDCQVGSGVIMANGATLAGHCVVGDRAFLSGFAAIHQFVRVGAVAILSGGAMAPLDVPPYCIAQGDRARLRGLNVVGMRRAGFSRDAIAAVKRAYKTLFFEGLPLAEASAKVRGEHCLPEPLALAEFVSQSKRGLTRPEAEEQEELSAA